MKKIILFIIMIGPLTLLSQTPQISNNSFENWTDQIFKSLDDYQDSGDENYGEITQSTDAIDGQYSVKISSILDNNNDVAVGYFINFDPDHFTGGMPYNQHVDSICGYYKAHLVAQDSALLVALFKFNSSRIGGNIYKFAADRNTNDWTRFCYPTNMPPTAVSDTLMFGAASSNAISETGMEVGSWIQFDSISLKSGNQLLPPISNYSFENWNEKTVSFPDDFDSSLRWSITSNPLSVQKSTDATSGNYAVKLNTVVNQEQDTIVGALTNGTIGHWPFEGGMPLNRIPSEVSYDYKVHYAGHVDFDPNLQFIFKLNGQEIGNFGRTYQSEVSVYQHESIPINIGTVPDTLQFNAFSGNFPGNNLWIDNIVLYYPAGITDNLNIQEMVAFPVPAKNRLNFKIEAVKKEPIAIEIIDINGRILFKKTFVLNQGGNQIYLKTNTLPKGTYLYRIKDGSGIITKQFIKI